MLPGQNYNNYGNNNNNYRPGYNNQGSYGSPTVPYLPGQTGVRWNAGANNQVPVGGLALAVMAFFV